MGCHAFVQGNFPTQGSNPDIPHCGQMLYRLSQQRRPGPGAALWPPALPPGLLSVPTIVVSGSREAPRFTQNWMDASATFREESEASL